MILTAVKRNFQMLTTERLLTIFSTIFPISPYEFKVFYTVQRKQNDFINMYIRIIH